MSNRFKVQQSLLAAGIAFCVGGIAFSATQGSPASPGGGTEASPWRVDGLSSAPQEDPVCPGSGTGDDPWIFEGSRCDIPSSGWVKYVLSAAGDPDDNFILHVSVNGEEQPLKIFSAKDREWVATRHLNETSTS